MSAKGQPEVQNIGQHDGYGERSAQRENLEATRRKIEQIAAELEALCKQGPRKLP